MTGYLQRLITAATTPSRLHPFTAPLHGGQIAPAPALIRQQDIAGQPPDHPPPPRIATADVLAAPNAETEIAAPAGNIQTSPPDALQQPRAAPALPPSMPPPAASRAEAPTRPSPLQTEIITKSIAAAPARSATPTLPEIVARLTDPAPGTAPFIAPPPRRAQPDTRAAQPAAEPTQVNIHIGRVDVIAVPTPAPRPAASAAASARKPMSLDEYLRRQDGRA